LLLSEDDEELQLDITDGDTKEKLKKGEREIAEDSVDFSPTIQRTSQYIIHYDSKYRINIS
jgi:hypothetical protein